MKSRNLRISLPATQVGYQPRRPIRPKWASQELTRDTNNTRHGYRGRKRTKASEQINDGTCTPALGLTTVCDDKFVKLFHILIREILLPKTHPPDVNVGGRNKSQLCRSKGQDRKLEWCAKNSTDDRFRLELRAAGKKKPGSKLLL
ncbi:hypothetical protein EVAR_61028_1 [Eumeta japonica]|uniref:Uncharacterized protein n=1 Tax=Eumeta variegata TaxID=151549 RepID=A0A4C1ZP42_EUMVA|nr:hypothetical protein EVAR_61028_1 [Eumeta japonica]